MQKENNEQFRPVRILRRGIENRVNLTNIQNSAGGGRKLADGSALDGPGTDLKVSDLKLLSKLKLL